MQSVHFEQAIANILKREPSFSKDAYFFLKEALDRTVTERQKDDPYAVQHVTAQELLVGFRDFALEEFGPMASTLLAEWGIQSSADIGTMVFGLIEEGVFGKQDSDERSDFNEGFDFHESFVAPFLPKSQNA
ncbi:Minf_1886 family protein [Rubritalea marina]|uniref:Minf_1886 family protein n=1 Tax=Rubritalea marina TaxID=361055 RepID=UPI0003821157|nr:Minf_1886 family protein [Rubritalea marina]